ncbi:MULTISPECIES: mannonate dehydratase [unclassified Sulfitobacter]|uniref:mannonate dehydratase n=1 Tax=unclassified Sulfitobacter TaxID=196795 RepID=UPI0023E1B484|nr:MULTISPECIES: mannonate dehydratase [unclassified Sulfitobacter]
MCVRCETFKAICCCILTVSGKRIITIPPYFQTETLPDHGHELLADIGRCSIPGYPLIDRTRGLAEIRGVIHAVERLAGNAGSF